MKGREGKGRAEKGREGKGRNQRSAYSYPQMKLRDSRALGRAVTPAHTSRPLESSRLGAVSRAQRSCCQGLQSGCLISASSWILRGPVDSPRLENLEGYGCQWPWGSASKMASGNGGMPKVKSLESILHFIHTGRSLSYGESRLQGRNDQECCSPRAS
jgi:hypothetical protein